MFEGGEEEEEGEEEGRGGDRSSLNKSRINRFSFHITRGRLPPPLASRAPATARLAPTTPLLRLKKFHRFPRLPHLVFPT
jgi:hypothetical protein